VSAYEQAQTATTYPARSERLAMLALGWLLALNLIMLVRATTYSPDCMPVIIESEENE